MNVKASYERIPAALYRQWWGALLVGSAVVAATTAVLLAVWPFRHAALWGATGGITLAYVFGYLRYGLKYNRAAASERIIPHLGPANSLTVTRGILAAVLSGFLFVPEPHGPLAWLPAGLYLTIGVLDYLDGLLARSGGRESILGSKMDMTYDALGTVVAIAVAVRYGQLPAVYLGIGLLYYVFHGHMYLRRIRNLPVHPLPPSRRRRFYAGCLFGFLAVALAPPMQPPATVLAGWLFAVPVAAGFVHDWLVAIGRADVASPRYLRIRARMQSILFDRLPVALRGFAVVAGLILLGRGLWGPATWSARITDVTMVAPLVPASTLVLVLVLSLASVGLGWMGRLGAVGLLGVGCADILLASFDTVNGAVLLGSISLLLLGTGILSLNTADAEQILRHAGTPTSSSTE